MERFEKSNHAFGQTTVPKEESNLIFPMTLDLRLQVPERKTHTEQQGLFQ